MIKDDLNIDDDLEDLDTESFDDSEVDVLSCTSEQLCSTVIAFRYLGVFKHAAILAMQELSARRAKGDQFNFEDFIQNEVKALPNLNSNDFDFSKIFKIK